MQCSFGVSGNGNIIYAALPLFKKSFLSHSYSETPFTFTLLTAYPYEKVFTTYYL